MSIAEAAMDGSPRLAEPTFDEGAVISFKDTQTGVDQLAFRDDHHVESPRQFVSTKDLSNQSLSFVSLNRSTQLSGRRNPQSTHGLVIRQEEHGAIPAAHLEAAIIDPLKFSSAPNSFVGTKAWHSLGRKPRLLTRSKPLDACGLSRDDASERCDRSWWPSGRGSHGFASGGVCSAGMYAFPSSVTPRFRGLDTDGARPSSALAPPWRKFLNRTGNVIERVHGVSICATVCVLHGPAPGDASSNVPLVSHQSFPHLWKKLWKIATFSLLGLFLVIYRRNFVEDR